MPQYLFAVHHDKTAPMMSEERRQQSYADVGAFNEMLKERGALVYANGITDPSEAVLIDNTGQSPEVSAKTYIPGDKYLGGFWVIDAPDLATAHAWAHQASKACNEPVEVRPFHS